MNHRFHDEALDDIDAAVNYYHAVVANGRAFAAEIKRIVGLLVVTPQMFSKAAGAPRGREIRVVKIGRFDYLLYHEVLATEVVTLAVVHAKRRSRVWRKRKP